MPLMSTTKSFSRRSFMKSAAVASTAALAVSALSSCSNDMRELSVKPLFSGKNYSAADGISGLLFSQIGYELGWPVRVVIRLPKKELVIKPVCKLTATNTEKNYQTEFNYHSEIWGSHWWVADFREINEEGVWNVLVTDGSETIFGAENLKVGKDILWKSTVELCAADMLERRVHFTKVGAGWQDAGTLWVESPAQSAMVISLCELIENKAAAISDDLKKRIFKQITVGCDYFVMLEKKAKELGYPEGAQSHDLHGHEKDILPNDAMKTVVALLKAVKLLPQEFNDKIQQYKATAKRAFQWLSTTAKPMGDYGFVRMQRGLSADAVIPEDEWLTRDLLTMCQASLEMMKSGNEKAKELAAAYANKVMARQISKEQAIAGIYGNFREFDSLKHAEPSWVHGIVPGKNGVEFGADLGGVYPNYLMPLIEMLKLFPDHTDAVKWRECLKSFAYNYLIPTCEMNPFYLVPQGIFEGEGPIWFCGTFHGTNAIYGYTAAMALGLAKFFEEPKLREIAYGNLLWLAGLNAGITKENVALGCVVFSTDVPEGAALPASMMCGVGTRWAGTWFQTRGVICNGFSTGKQFVYDTEPKKANDGPNSLTDEDWIPHSAGWLTGLMRL
jgi:hypothetical protein